MLNKTSPPGAQQKRLAAYLDSLARAAGHADRSEPLKGYCRGLLLPLKRKSVEPINVSTATLESIREKPFPSNRFRLVALSPDAKEERRTVQLIRGHYTSAVEFVV